MIVEQAIADLSAIQLDLAEIAALPEDVINEMLEKEAEIIKKGQKTVARSMGVYDTGLMIKSIEAGDLKTKSDGSHAIYITPQASRKRKKNTTRNTEIAFINEYGKRGQSPRPFMRTANERYATEAVDAAFKVYDNYLKSKNL